MHAATCYVFEIIYNSSVCTVDLMNCRNIEHSNLERLKAATNLFPVLWMPFVAAQRGWSQMASFSKFEFLNDSEN